MFNQYRIKTIVSRIIFDGAYLLYIDMFKMILRFNVDLRRMLQIYDVSIFMLEIYHNRYPQYHSSQT